MSSLETKVKRRGRIGKEYACDSCGCKQTKKNKLVNFIEGTEWYNIISHEVLCLNCFVRIAHNRISTLQDLTNNYYTKLDEDIYKTSLEISKFVLNETKWKQ